MINLHSVFQLKLMSFKVIHQFHSNNLQIYYAKKHNRQHGEFQNNSNWIGFEIHLAVRLHLAKNKKVKAENHSINVNYFVRFAFLQLSLTYFSNISRLSGNYLIMQFGSCAGF